MRHNISNTVLKTKTKYILLRNPVRAKFQELLVGAAIPGAHGGHGRQVPGVNNHVTLEAQHIKNSFKNKNKIYMYTRENKYIYTVYTHTKFVVKWVLYTDYIHVNQTCLTQVASLNGSAGDTRLFIQRF